MNDIKQKIVDILKNGDFYDINMHIAINKRDWHDYNNVFDENIIMNKIQLGFKIPIKNCEIIIVK